MCAKEYVCYCSLYFKGCFVDILTLQRVSHKDRGIYLLQEVKMPSVTSTESSLPGTFLYDFSVSVSVSLTVSCSFSPADL